VRWHEPDKSRGFVQQEIDLPGQKSGAQQIARVRHELAKGLGIGRVARMTIKTKIKRDGHFTTKSGIVRRRLGRPDIS
jgi:hypothetical protein